MKLYHSSDVSVTYSAAATDISHLSYGMNIMKYPNRISRMTCLILSYAR